MTLHNHNGSAGKGKDPLLPKIRVALAVVTDWLTNIVHTVVVLCVFILFTSLYYGITRYTFAISVTMNCVSKYGMLRFKLRFCWCNIL